MVKKGKEDSDNENKDDFRSVGDMTEFLHPEDIEVELKFKQLNVTTESDECILEETPPELPGEILPDLEEEVLPDFSFAETTAFTDERIEESATVAAPEEISEAIPDESFFLSDLGEDLEDFSEEIPEEIQETIQAEPIKYQPPETFKEVQNFAQNFSYGEILAGGNPPFSLLVKNIKFKEDADDMLALLKEYQIVGPENEKDFIRSFEYGMLLIPQIGEYLAIILTHKFRRFDCEIEMGLSDQIKPSRSGEVNPKGLTKKTQLSQNKNESFLLEKKQTPIAEIIVTTTSSIAGHKILKYHGIETAFRMIETVDLERLNFIQNQLNQFLDSLDENTQSDYFEYSSDFNRIYTDLLQELKEKAAGLNTNALLGVAFNLASFSENKFQLTCSATLATVSPEDETETEQEAVQEIDIEI
jgi:uncharacterized protein YbjQ (UPF0145 family)